MMAVTVTPAGEDALAGARAAWETAHRSVSSALGPDARAVLDIWLEQLLAVPAPPPAGAASADD